MDKKEKKAAIRARNRKTHIAQSHARKAEEQRQAARDAQHELTQQSASAPAGDLDQPWTARTEMIRNRITGKKRASMDRWNRFAGTSGSGGRGR